MSKDVIKNKDLGVLESLQSFLMNFVINPEQQLFLEISLDAKVSPAWDGKIAGVYPAQRRLHDINDAIRKEKTKYHIGGLTTAEFFQLAIALGIDRNEAETNKGLFWEQIKRRLNPDLSRAETQTILRIVLDTLTEEEIRWLREYRPVSWKDYYADSSERTKNKATTLTDCSLRIEDIVCAMENHTDFNGYHGRVCKHHLVLLGNRLGIFSFSAGNLPKGVLKARMLKK